MKADLVIRGGRVFTADPEFPMTTAVAASDGFVVALGDDAEQLVGRRTNVVDLRGAMATPGFIDAHVHPASSGLDKLRCHFDGVSDAMGALHRVVEYSRRHPELPWVIGAGWQQSWFPGGCPSREMLDEMISDRPVLLTNTDGHGAWVNTRAMEIAGIDEATQDPADGRIERLADGSPQGTLHEGAVRLVERKAPSDTVDDLTAGLIRGQNELLRYGITGWQDAIVDEVIHDAYLRVANRGELVGRVVGAMWWSRHHGMDQIAALVERRARGAPGFSPTSVKLMLDGVAENHTASMLSPYLRGDGGEDGETGIDFIDPDELKEIVTLLDATGFQCHFHAIGDAAVRSALDAVEEARLGNGANDNRHHIAHLQVVHPDDVPRFATLGVVANAQPLWACNDDYQVELTRPFLGEDRYSWQYPFAALLSSGARLGMGSDWGVSTANVMEEIEVAVTRTCSADGPLMPDQTITAVEALTAFTAGSAFINHVEDVAGSLAVGKLADFAVLDRDPLNEGSFEGTSVELTVVGGEISYEKS